MEDGNWGDAPRDRRKEGLYRRIQSLQPWKWVAELSRSKARRSCSCVLCGLVRWCLFALKQRPVLLYNVPENQKPDTFINPRFFPPFCIFLFCYFHWVRKKFIVLGIFNYWIRYFSLFFFAEYKFWLGRYISYKIKENYWLQWIFMMKFTYNLSRDNDNSVGCIFNCFNISRACLDTQFI